MFSQVQNVESRMMLSYSGTAQEILVSLQEQDKILLKPLGEFQASIKTDPRVA